MENEVLNQLKDSELPECDLEKLVEENNLNFELLSSFENKEFALALLNTSREYLGVSRADNIEQVSRFLKLFNLPTKMQGKWVPYCAAGLSFAAAKTFCDLSGIKYNQNNAISVFRSVLLKIKDRFFRPTARCWRMYCPTMWLAKSGGLNFPQKSSRLAGIWTAGTLLKEPMMMVQDACKALRSSVP